MKSVNLSAKEVAILTSAIADALEHRNRQLKQSITWILLGSILGAILLYLKDENSMINKLIAAVLYGLFMSLLMFVFWKLTRRSIGKLEKDLAAGTKTIGSSEIVSRNIFNRNVKLSDGTLIYGAYVEKYWMKGDVIEYEVTPSNQYLFNCKNASQQNR